MTKTSKCSQRLAHKFICIWVLLSSTHQVAQAVVNKKVTKVKNCKAKSCKANNSKARTQQSDTYLCSSDNAGDPILLGECEGDCNNDDDCEVALNCRKNGDEDTVPGCEGCVPDGMNYCYARPADSSDGLPYLWFVANKEEGDETFSLGECEGDCDENTDCDEGLNCRKRNDGDEDTVPGCVGKASGEKDYCYARPSADMPGSLPYLWIIREKGAEPDDDNEPQDAFPLGECEGDCDKHTDCKEGLNCFKRENDEEPVPGCVGKASGGKDYCYARPPADMPGSLPYLWIIREKGEEPDDDNEPRDAFPLGECEGDCNQHTDCKEGLNCFNRENDEEQPVPGCVGSTSRRKDYCYARPAANTEGPYLWIVREKGAEPDDDNEPRDAFPLGECEGDCDNNSHCKDGLKCFKRDEVDAEVLGCVGIATGKKDYCIPI